MYTSITEIPKIVNSLRETFRTGNFFIYYNFFISKLIIIGLTKNKDYRRQQLKNFLKLMSENQDEIVKTVEKDLHKHKIEIISGEIAPVIGEIEYMLSVSSV
jgi:aldehyde dehydrogenase (NAD+)/aldehyde dehydrogenase (NAD(P)+)